MKKIIYVFATALAFSLASYSQVPMAVLIKIAKAEDARAYDKNLEDLINSPNAAIQKRAALAAGRIGNDEALPALTKLLETGVSEDVRTMAAFAIGEIESIKGADAILKAIGKQKAEIRPVGSVSNVTARLVEAAGKIAAANAKDEKAKALGQAIIDTLIAEDKKGANQNHEVVLLAITAALRARPSETGVVVAKFLTNPDAHIRADAANTLSRVRAKNANAELRAMLVNEKDPVARSNAARALGAAEDKEALEPLLKAATDDTDSRVRVSAIRALGSLKDAKVGDKLLERGNEILKLFKGEFYDSAPGEKNELLEICASLGRLLQGAKNKIAVEFLHDAGKNESYNSPEIHIAIARISPEEALVYPYMPYVCDVNYSRSRPSCWRLISGWAQGLGELANIERTDPIRIKAAADIKSSLLARKKSQYATDQIATKAIPDMLRSYAAFKEPDTSSILVQFFTFDPFICATVAELLANQPASKENVEALKKAFDKALLTDKHDNDAQLAILSALFKLDKKESVGTLLIALNAQDYLVRKKGFDLLADKDLQKDFPGIPTSLEIARAKHKDQVLPYSPAFGTKLGQVLNTEADYRRALSRKNGTVKAVLATEKGTFTIIFNPEEAPLTVDNFVKLARSGYFNGLEVHRVVPNFVMQDGDPRGDGNGGPGWSIRCEINTLPFDRGAVGMALSGKDTGGSQWFVTHAPQPHLDGGYTVFGHVNNVDMKVVDNIVRGDKIISVKIIERGLPQRKIK